MCEEDSIAALLLRVRSGDDPDSEQAIWDRYFPALVDRGRRRLRQGTGSERDEEDVVVSVFDSFFRRIRGGRADNIVDRTSLWIFLSWLMRNKLYDEYRRREAQKRNMPRPGDLSDAEAAEAWYREIADGEPTPEQVAEFTEWFESLLDALPDDKRTVAVFRLAGLTNAEIAEKVGRVERTVERWLHDIRSTWTAEFGLDDDE